MVIALAYKHEGEFVNHNYSNPSAPLQKKWNRTQFCADFREQVEAQRAQAQPQTVITLSRNIGVPIRCLLTLREVEQKLNAV